MSASQSAETTPGGEGRLSRSWRLTRAAWQVVRDDRALLTLGGLSVVVGGIGLAAIFILSGSFHHGRLRGARSPCSH